MGKDWIVTVWVPFVVRVENMDDRAMAKSVAQDYLEQLDPLTGEDTLAKILDRESDPTVFRLDMDEGLIMHAAVAEDSEEYEDDEPPVGPHEDHEHLTEGCPECDAEAAEAFRLYGQGTRIYREDDPEYRRDMIDAGRGHLLP